MQVGLSIGKCVADLLHGKVQERDVLCIVGQCYATSLDQFQGLCEKYREMGRFDRDNYSPDAEVCSELATRLWVSGRIHLPRNFGASALFQNDEIDHWITFIPAPRTMNDFTRSAWDMFQAAVRISSDDLTEDEKLMQWRESMPW